MDEAFFIIPVLYMAGVLAVVVLAILALWRIMKAQEATAAALQQIAHSVSRLRPPG